LSMAGCVQGFNGDPLPDLKRLSMCRSLRD
jgi:hypothetical protein